MPSWRENLSFSDRLAAIVKMHVGLPRPGPVGAGANRAMGTVRPSMRIHIRVLQQRKLLSIPKVWSQPFLAAPRKL